MTSYMGKVLFVDLTEERCEVRDLSGTVRDTFIGGKGLGACLLWNLYGQGRGPGVDPLSPEASILYVTGPLTATLAPSMRGCVVGKSPLTGLFDDSYFGGHFSQEVKYAGYDAVVIRGRAARPLYLLIEDDRVRFNDAADLWGRDTYETVERLKSELGDDSVRISCIGPAGENLVRFALVDCEPHRHAGRGGLGAVMGSKKLKAVAVRGTRPVGVADGQAFTRAVARAWAELRTSAGSLDLSSYSTVSGFPFANQHGYFPVRNFSDGSLPEDKASRLEARRHEERLWVRHAACAACPIHCSKVSLIRTGEFRGTVCDNVEYETLGLLGGNLDVTDIEQLSYLNLVCDKLGLDTMSAGGVCAFAIEAHRMGILEDTDGLSLAFGDTRTVLALLGKIARREGVGDVLADGVRAAAQVLGGGADRLAVHVAGLETPAWGPRGSAGMGLAYLTGDRGGCHQRAFPIAYETSTPWKDGKPLDPFAVEGKADLVAWEQNLLAGLYSLTICEFGRSGISLRTYLDMLAAATGQRLDEAQFTSTGERIWNLIRLFNLREGLRAEDVRLPAKFSEPLPSGIHEGHRFTVSDEHTMLADYYRARGWDHAGHPTDAKLRELGLSGRLDVVD